MLVRTSIIIFALYIDRNILFYKQLEIYYEFLGCVFNRTNNIFVLSFYKPFITVYFFLALRGSPFVFSLPCLLNRRKNNR